MVDLLRGGCNVISIQAGFNLLEGTESEDTSIKVALVVLCLKSLKLLIEVLLHLVLLLIKFLFLLLCQESGVVECFFEDKSLLLEFEIFESELIFVFADFEVGLVRDGQFFTIELLRFFVDLVVDLGTLLVIFRLLLLDSDVGLLSEFLHAHIGGISHNFKVDGNLVLELGKFLIDLHAVDLGLTALQISVLLLHVLEKLCVDDVHIGDLCGLHFDTVALQGGLELLADLLPDNISFLHDFVNGQLCDLITHNCSQTFSKLVVGCIWNFVAKIG